MLSGARVSMSLLSHGLYVISDKIDNRVLSFDLSASKHAGDLMASRRGKGRPVDLRDTKIAGIVLGQHASLATRNVPHFDDISASVINPWAVGTPPKALS
jgi:hypothetical protein